MTGALCSGLCLYQCTKDRWNWPATAFLFPHWLHNCWGMSLSSCSFSYICSETLDSSFLLPIMIFMQYVGSCTEWVSEQQAHSVTQTVFVFTNYKLIFLPWAFFLKSFWPHLYHKWNLSIRARAWNASNLIFVANSSTTGRLFPFFPPFFSLLFLLFPLPFPSPSCREE